MEFTGVRWGSLSHCEYDHIAYLMVSSWNLSLFPGGWAVPNACLFWLPWSRGFLPL